jgi:hypothetical protein
MVGRFSSDVITSSLVAGKLAPTTWENALTIIADKLKGTKPEEMEGIAGTFADAEVCAQATW